MEQYIIIPILVIPLNILTVCLFAFLVNAIPAYKRTKKWDKARRQSATDTELELELEENTLLSPQSDEADSFDTDDETELNERKADQEMDKSLTFRQKRLKEFEDQWKGKVAEKAVMDKEREERRKLAKAVARELDRIEGRRMTEFESEAQDAEALPPYCKA